MQNVNNQDDFRAMNEPVNNCSVDKFLYYINICFNETMVGFEMDEKMTIL